MFLPTLTICLAMALSAGPLSEPARATDDPQERTDGLYVGHEIGRSAERVTVELRGWSVVILDRSAIGVMSIDRWALVLPGGKGGDLQFKGNALPRLAASRDGKVKAPPKRAQSAMRLRLWPASKEAVLCMSEPGKGPADIRHVPTPLATDPSDAGVTCYSLVRVWSAHDEPKPTPAPEPEFECMRECRQQNMMRAVGPEEIEADCRRACTTP